MNMKIPSPAPTTVNMSVVDVILKEIHTSAMIRPKIAFNIFAVLSFISSPPHTF